MTQTFFAMLRRIFTTSYAPNPQLQTFQARALTQQNQQAEVTVAVLDAHESEQFFGVPLARRGLQPVYLKVENRSPKPLRLQAVSIDPNYFTSLEAAATNHFSILKRLSAFGLLAWFLLPLVLLVIPFKLITAYRANRRMDELFRDKGFRLRPIPPGTTREGFIFTRFDSGTKMVHVCLHSTGNSLAALAARAKEPSPVAIESAEDSQLAPEAAIEFLFSMPVPGITVDYHRRDFSAMESAEPIIQCEIPQLVEHLQKMPATVSNHRGSGTGDPVNLVVIGDFTTLISAFAARWDETETITLATCGKTLKAFLFGSQYRYSPVSALYLFGRGQDVALQRSRRSINERLHLRLWLTNLKFASKPVWVGQVSRDIGVRFTLKTWNLTTHRIDPDVDEARDYVTEDLLEAERVDAAAYLDGVGPCEPQTPRRNLTGDPYFTDGKRAVILLSENRTPPRFVAWT